MVVSRARRILNCTFSSPCQSTVRKSPLYLDFIPHPASPCPSLLLRPFAHFLPFFIRPLPSSISFVQDSFRPFGFHVPRPGYLSLLISRAFLPVVFRPVVYRLCYSMPQDIEHRPTREKSVVSRINRQSCSKLLPNEQSVCNDDAS